MLITSLLEYHMVTIKSICGDELTTKKSTDILYIVQDGDYIVQIVH